MRFAAVLLVVCAACAWSRAETVYFLVAELPGQETHGDSYVLPLSDPAQIVHARDLIARGPFVAGEFIVMADIAAGADGINRDLLAAGDPKPPWSWHVTNVEGFVDITAELFDSWPTFVEQKPRRVDRRHWREDRVLDVYRARRADRPARGFADRSKRCRCPVRRAPPRWGWPS
jgi:hypothetical protein